MSEQRNLWGFRVKGGSGKDQFNRSLELKRVLYGWSELPLEQWVKESNKVLTFEKLNERLLTVWNGYFQNHQRSLALHARMLWNYMFEMKKGDIAIVPTYRQFAIGEFTGEIGRELDELSQEEDIVNWRGVKWLTGPINRRDLTSAFQSSLKDHRAIFQLNQYSDEIDGLLERGLTKASDIYATNSIARKSEVIFKIQKHLASRQTRVTPNDFEKLFADLICLESNNFFNALTTSNQEEALSGADVIVESTSESLDIKLKIQVKLHEGETGRSGVEQILKRKDPSNVLPMFVTSGLFSKEAEDLAEENGVLLVDGMQVAEMICSNLDHLSDSLRAKLGLFNLPIFIEE